MSKSTRATLFLDQAGLPYRLHAYDYQAEAAAKGLHAAHSLGLAPERVLKTLMARVDGKPVCVVLASDSKLSQKKLAAAAGGKAAQMMEAADAERLTGYKVGGISPFGQQRKSPTLIDAAALIHSSVWINAGQRGLLLEVAPQQALDVLGATAADLRA